MFQYPYGDTQQLNLDWLMEQWQETKASIDGSLQGEIDRVEAAITDLLTARDQAVAAKTAAETAATSASGYAGTASTAASTATAQATAAAGSAALAGTHASNAQTSETNAGLQATAAGNSAAAAAVSAGNASNSEGAAAASSSAAAGNALYAEGMAKGTQNGTPVTSGSPYYEDNAAYWAGEAQSHASNAIAASYYSEAMAKGTVNGTPVASGDPGYEDNAEYYKDQAAAQAAAASAASADGTNAQKMIAAPEEATSTAAAAHAAGTYFRYNSKLYKATQDIPLGGTITPNTNCVEDTVCAELTAQSEQIAAVNNEVQYDTNNIQSLKEAFTGTSQIYMSYQYGRYIDNGYNNALKQYINSINMLPAGVYSFTSTLGANYTYGVYEYTSDSAGIEKQSFRNGSSFGLNLTGAKNKICVRKLDGVAFTQEEISSVMSNLIVTKQATVPNKYDYISEESNRIVLDNFSVDYNSGIGHISNEYGVNGQQSVFIENASGTLADLRVIPNSAIDPTGISEVILYLYIPDYTKISSITLALTGTSYTRSYVPTKNGYTKIRFLTFDGDVTTWSSISRFRIYASGTQGLSFYFCRLEYVKPTIGNLIFVEDGGFESFYTDGYPDLKELGVPTTWALDCGLLGNGRISQEQVNAIAADAFSEWSYHGWLSERTALMSAAEIQEESAKCIYYLKSHGLDPIHIWRAAHTQNEAPNADAQIGMVEALATSTSVSGYTTFPFPNPYNVPRRALHNMSESDIDAMFAMIQKTHCSIVLYTHGIGSGSYETTSAIWETFIGKLETALESGYIRGTTYSRLETERLVSKVG